jgi:hypothetical protein
MTRTLALAVLVCLSGSRPGVQTIPATKEPAQAAVLFERESDPGHRTPPPMASAAQSRPVQRPLALASISGIASWGRPWAGVVTRLPRGTRICVTGPLGWWCGRSVGYGPARRTGRIADLSATVFGLICGPLSRGLCRVTLSWR